MAFLTARVATDQLAAYEVDTAACRLGRAVSSCCRANRSPEILHSAAAIRRRWRTASASIRPSDATGAGLGTPGHAGERHLLSSRRRLLRRCPAGDRPLHVPEPPPSPRIDSSRNEMSLRPRSTDSSSGVMPRTLCACILAPRLSASFTVARSPRLIASNMASFGAMSDGVLVAGATGARALAPGNTSGGTSRFSAFAAPACARRCAPEAIGIDYRPALVPKPRFRAPKDRINTPAAAPSSRTARRVPANCVMCLTRTSQNLPAILPAETWSRR